VAAARILRFLRLAGKFVFGVVALVGLIETARGAPETAKWLNDAGLTGTHTLGMVVAAMIASIFGLLFAGPERVKRWWLLARGHSQARVKPSAQTGQGKGHIEIGEQTSRVVVRSELQPELDFGAVLPHKNALVIAYRERLRKEREPIRERLRTLAGRIEDHVDARAAERPLSAAHLYQAVGNAWNPQQQEHHKGLSEYELHTLGLYYLKDRQEAAEAMEVVQRLGLATDGQIQEVRKPATVAKLAALPRMLRETADLLAVQL
jgi:hypothetical protein